MRYQPHPHREERITSAVTALRAILPLDLYAAHKRELIDVCIWKITEADGKYKTRYWSEGALDSPRSQWRHEHVFEKKELIQRLLGGEKLGCVLADTVACIVTKEEHLLLGASSSSGWKRYRDAGIQVFDTTDMSTLGHLQPVQLPASTQ